MLVNMDAIHIKIEPNQIIKQERFEEESLPRSLGCVVSVHPDAADAHLMTVASRILQEDMAIKGRVICANKMNVLLCNLRMLTRLPQKMLYRGSAPRNMEFFDSTAARGIAGAIEAATSLLPKRPELDDVLRLLGRFSSVENCAVAPKGTRKLILSTIDQLSKNAV